MTILKISFNNDIRRVTVAEKPSLEALRALIENLYTGTSPSHFVIKYADDENDLITITSERELSEAFAFAGTADNALLRLHVVESKGPSVSIPIPIRREAPAPSPAAPPSSPKVDKGKAKETSQPAAQPSLQEVLQQVSSEFGSLFEEIAGSPEVNNFLSALQGERNNLNTNVQSLMQQLLGSGNAFLVNAALNNPQLILPLIQQFGEHSPLAPIIAEVKQAFKGASCPSSGSASCSQKASSSAEGSSSVLVHRAICDNCEKGITGIRYKCAVCANYDLCEECEAKGGVHDPAHAFIKLRRLLPWSLEHQPLVAGLGTPSPSTSQQPRGGCPFAQGRCGRSWGARRGPGCGYTARCHSNIALYRSRFIADITIPDGTELVAGTQFLKTWRLSNNGTVPWPLGSQLVFVSGTALGREGLEAVPVPPLAPGEELDISVPMVAPSAPGTCASFWRLTTPEGSLFGHQVWAEINVVEKPREEVENDDEEEDEVASEENDTTVVIEEWTEEEASEDASAEFVEQPTVVLIDSRNIEDGGFTAPDVEVITNEVPVIAEEPAKKAEEPKTEEAKTEDDPFADALIQLEQMGFGDRSLNRLLLIANRGNLLTVVHQLLSM